MAKKTPGVDVFMNSIRNILACIVVKAQMLKAPIPTFFRNHVHMRR